MNHFHMGIGIGASRVKIVLVAGDSGERRVQMRDHLGDPHGTLAAMLAGVPPLDILSYAVAGRAGASLLDGRRVYESEAIEAVLRDRGLHADLVVSLGGESFAVYRWGRTGPCSTACRATGARPARSSSTSSSWAGWG